MLVRKLRNAKLPLEYPVKKAVEIYLTRIGTTLKVFLYITGLLLIVYTIKSTDFINIVSFILGLLLSIRFKYRVDTVIKLVLCIIGLFLFNKIITPIQFINIFSFILGFLLSRIINYSRSKNISNIKQ